MANTALTASVVAKAALAVLENNLGVLNTLYRAHEDEFDARVNGYKVGDTISIRRPADFTVRSGATLTTQDVIEGKVNLQVAQQIGVDFQFTSVEMTMNVTQLAMRVIKPAMSNIINFMSNDVMTVAKNGTYSWVGTPGTRITNFLGFSKAPERLDEMAAPTDDRAAVLCPNDYWGELTGQSGLFISGAANDAFRNGNMGPIGGVDTYMSQVTPTHTVGPLGGAPLINGGAQNVTYDTAKNTWSQSLITDGWTAAAAQRFAAGDVFTIANVFSVNPKTKISTGILQQFVVAANTSSDGSGNLTATISPPIITSGPYQTVNSVPADNAAMTVLGTANTSYRTNLCYHKNAMALACVPMEMPPAAYGGARESYKGFSVRVIPIYDGTNDISKWRLDMLYGRALIDPRIITRVSGT